MKCSSLIAFSSVWFVLCAVNMCVADDTKIATIHSPLTIQKDLNIKNGSLPKIEGLPSKLNFFGDDDDQNFIPFKVSGSPSPKLKFYFNGEEIQKNDQRFAIYQTSAGQYILKIRKMSERVAGKFRVNATNLIGNYEKVMVFEGNWQWTREESRLITVACPVSGLLLILVIFFILRPRQSGKTKAKPTTSYEYNSSDVRLL